MDAQVAIDLMVLMMRDTEVIHNIKRNRAAYTATNDERHNEMIAMLVKGFDNTYGEGSYHKYLADGTLPSEQ